MPYQYHLTCPADNCNEDALVHSYVANSPQYCPNCGAEANVSEVPDDEQFTPKH